MRYLVFILLSISSLSYSQGTRYDISERLQRYLVAGFPVQWGIPVTDASGEQEYTLLSTFAGNGLAWSGNKYIVDSSKFISSYDLTSHIIADDHTQYVLLAGRSSGQTIRGGTGALDDLVFRPTSGNAGSTSFISFQTGNNGATEGMRIFNTGTIGMGVTSSAIGTAKLNIESTTAQLKIGYNSTNYYTTTVASGGNPTFAITGSTNKFTFGGHVEIPNVDFDGGFDGTNYAVTQNAIYDAFRSGTWTPTVTNETNTDAPPVATEAQFAKTYLSVTCSGRFELDPSSANSVIQFEIDLPISSTITDIHFIGGTCTSILNGTDVTCAGEIIGNTTNNTAQIQIVLPSTANLDEYSWTYHFTYRIN